MKSIPQSIRTAIDIGSTTIKAVVLNGFDEIIFESYERHNTHISTALSGLINQMFEALGNQTLDLRFTGSAGMGVAERLDFPFVQEVQAARNAIERWHPLCRTLIDVGGEDSKIIFFDDTLRPDMRMNGNCAGGTGAFIDQMATLLGIIPADLDELAAEANGTEVIATRCGVFAKTDVQNLLSRGVERSNIAASIFRAVAVQTINALARGRHPQAEVILCGGPLTYLRELRVAFNQALGLSEDSLKLAKNPLLLPAMGAALCDVKQNRFISISELLLLSKAPSSVSNVVTQHEPVLFADDSEREEWVAHRFSPASHVEMNKKSEGHTFLGIDAGSTTTKLVLIDEEGRILFSHYVPNQGQHLTSVREGLVTLAKALSLAGVSEDAITRSCATGYGEDLIRAAYGVDDGVVETIAHFRAARAFCPEVNFVLDIGGQDIKAMSIVDGDIRGIEVNEACSSGCGSFIQTFAQSLGCDLALFAEKALEAKAPCSLGTRCTVFMNSRVKQSLRDGATIGDISAGLSYSVIKNCLYKVLKLKDISELGDHVVAQGGAFLNPAVHRALENLLGRRVIVPEIAGLMGAYGAALCAKDNFRATNEGSVFSLKRILKTAQEPDRQLMHCSGCQNSCEVIRLSFENGRKHYAGARCERVFSSKGQKKERGLTFTAIQEKLLFDRPTDPIVKPLLTIGIPRALNLYEDYPFWNALFINAGIKIVLSDPSSNHMQEKATGTVMSDNICFPAKLMHGHIFNLLEKKTDRIFYPMVVFEQPEGETANCFNCPIVTGYPEVIRSAINPEKRMGIPFDSPTFAFNDEKLLRKACVDYLRSLGVSAANAGKAYKEALKAQKEYHRILLEEGKKLIEAAHKKGHRIAVLACRPYHLDSLINRNVPEILADFGMDVITCDALPVLQHLDEMRVLTQWTYPNRLFNAVFWAERHSDTCLVQLNSFGCGPDAVAVDEMRELANSYGKNHAVIRVDEMTGHSSIRLRIRTMVETLSSENERRPFVRADNAQFEKQDRERTILVPFFSTFHSIYSQKGFEFQGYKAELLPEPDKESLQIGLKFTNNEICYPAILLIGDCLRALLSGKYDPDKVAIGLVQTGGQCRATNYLSLLKKALIRAGFVRVPVISLFTVRKNLNKQPGFHINNLKMMKQGFISVICGDALSKMYHALLPREKKVGSALEIAQRYITESFVYVKNCDYKGLAGMLRRAVDDFNAIETKNVQCPTIGIVGEIYVKYSDFGSHNLVRWLNEKGVEVVVPSLLDFFMKILMNAPVNAAANVKRSRILEIISKPLVHYIQSFIDRTNEILSVFKWFRPLHSIESLAAKASRVLNLTNQYGEGWLIPAEICAYAESGINEVISLQPFGCIANQVVAKGVEKRMRDLYPNLNLLYLDLDADTSEVNLHNRVLMLAESARLRLLHPLRRVEHTDLARHSTESDHADHHDLRSAGVVG